VIEEPSWYENIDPLTLGGAGGVLALLGAWFVYRRKKNTTADSFADSTFSTKDTQGGLLTADGGEAVDTFNSVFMSNFSEANAPIESAEVDPIAEADVYMQYGRDAHAEDILLDALKQNPTRHPVRLKLMELYASKGNQLSLNTQLETLSSLTQETGAEWLAARKIVASSSSSELATSTKLKDTTFNTQIDKPVIVSAQKNTNPAINSIKLSEPTMIGDLTDFNNTVPLKTGNDFNLNNLSAFEPSINLGDLNKPVALGALSGLKQPAPASNAGGINFNIQSPTVLGKPNNFGSGIAQSAQATRLELNSTIDFQLSKADGHPTSIMDKLTSNSGASVTPALETKLSLAKAYTDIGDKEGARELLQEVIDAGHQSLSEQAKALLIKL
jgi:pilus assembly protein FimV